MAKTPIRVGPALVATGPATIYTAPAAGTVIRWVNVVNPSGSPVDFTMSVNADASATRVYDDETIGAGGRLVDYPYLELDMGDTLQVSASTNNVLVLTVGGDELAGGGGSQTLAEVLVAGGDPGGNPITGAVTISPSDLISDSLTISPGAGNEGFPLTINSPFAPEDAYSLIDTHAVGEVYEPFSVSADGSCALAQVGGAKFTVRAGINTGTTFVVGVTEGAEVIGFFGAAPAAQPTGVAVDAAGIHAALVTLGLITA